jgi:DNA polymerase-3 subunit delta'
MKHNLSKFTTFALINATLEDAREFSQSLGTTNWNVFEDLKLQDVEKIRVKSYEFSETPNAFLIGKANLESQNALLKLTEEPTTYNYFIFYETEYIIDTLISRAQIVNFHVNPENIDKLFEFFKNNDKNGFLKELLNIKNVNKQNKAIFLKYLKSLISKLADNFPQKVNFLFEEYENLRTYNLNIDLFIAKVCIELWRT